MKRKSDKKKPSMQILSVELEKIVINPSRRPVRDVEGLAASLAKVGMLHPLTVTLDRDTGNYRLRAGRRRLEAARLLGWPVVPCNVLNVDDLHAELAGIDENLEHQELTALE